ncbi:MAG TPA: hypothetical protein PLS73_10720 [Saprospiraceae bacterium]|nr:hypothetical protein [Saprospiraceae bacterium]
MKTQQIIDKLIDFKNVFEEDYKNNPTNFDKGLLELEKESIYKTCPEKSNELFKIFNKIESSNRFPTDISDFNKLVEVLSNNKHEIDLIFESYKDSIVPSKVYTYEDLFNFKISQILNDAGNTHSRLDTFFKNEELKKKYNIED